MISIIIPVYNNHEMTKLCLESVVENSSNFEYEIIIVDNGSIPPYQKIYNEIVIRNEMNEGFPKAINKGIKHANGEIVVLLNNDCVVTPYWLDRIAKGLEKYDIVGVTTNYSSGIQKVDLPLYKNKHELFEKALEWTKGYEEKFVEVNWVIGFCMSFKKDVYLDVGEFDESLWPASGEEIDFCLRAKTKGYKIAVIVGVYIHHHGSQTFFDMQRKGILKYTNICEVTTKHIEKKWGGKIFNYQIGGIPWLKEERF